MADYSVGTNIRVTGGTSSCQWARDSLGPTTFEAAVAAQFDELEALLIAKHHNYGPLNILQSPGSPLTGIRVRIWDKLARVNHMLDNNVEDRVGENLLETFGDLANYGVIARMVILNQFALPMGKS